MAGYTRFWTCKACEKRMQTIDYPKIEICDLCIASDGMVAMRKDDLTTAQLMYNLAVEKFKARYK